MNAPRTTFTLDVPLGVDYPMALVVSNITTNPHFRSQVTMPTNSSGCHVLITFSFPASVLCQWVPVRQVWYVVAVCCHVGAAPVLMHCVVNSIGPQVSFPVRTCQAFYYTSTLGSGSRLRYASSRYPRLQRSQHACRLALGSRCRGREIQFACTRDDSYGGE
jgi:hypothetical protein